MRFAYYDRLSRANKEIYRRSDAIETLGVPRGLELGPTVTGIELALRKDDRNAVQAECGRLIYALVGGYHVPAVGVRVMAKRPSNNYGELHGLYEPGEKGSRARITVWMRTAQRQQVVAFRTFLRTLIHELCHHLDYELFSLEETFHTEGFYKRESSLANALLAQARGADSVPGAGA